MDYTIEVWSIQENHFAQCSCAWIRKSLYPRMLESYALSHKQMHINEGDSVEIV